MVATRAINCCNTAKIRAFLQRFSYHAIKFTESSNVPFVEEDLGDGFSADAFLYIFFEVRINVEIDIYILQPELFFELSFRTDAKRTAGYGVNDDSTLH